GRRHEIDEMHDKLEPYGILQFVRSGRITVTKEEMPITALLNKMYHD
ncbi:MAG: acetolactate synthase small subunit, partial [Eudoraea sp.]|nr:acetolactate synthase small subunit [Eudoraea sp.]